MVDVITGGSPCQDLSVAGKRAGLAGERSGLFMEQMRIVKEMRERDRADGRPAQLCRCRFMVWENVPGAYSSGSPKGADFAAVLEEIIKVAEPDADVRVCIPDGGWPKAGCYYAEDGAWSIAYRTHDAQFWGTPQRRKRIALVADFGGLAAPEILFERKGLRRDPEESPEQRQGTSEGIEASAGSSIFGIDQQGGKGSASYTRNVAPTLAADSHGTPHAISFHLTQDPISKVECTPAISTGNPKNGQSSLGVLCLNDQGGSVMNTSFDVTGTLRAEMGGHPPLVMNEPAVLPFNTTQITSPANGNHPRFGDPCHTLAAGDHPPSIIYSIGHDIRSARLTDDEITDPLTANDYKEPITVFALQGTGATSQNSQGSGYKEEQSFTLNTTDVHGVAYSFDSLASNSMKSSNPNSGCHKTDVSKALDTSSPDPSKNQGGIAIVYENHAQDSRIKELGDISESVSAKYGTGGNNQPLVLESNQNHAKVLDKGIVNALPAAMVEGGGYVPMICEKADSYQDVVGTVDCGIAKGTGNQLANQDMFVAKGSAVRRLTPLECERLQGFPDGWTDIGEWTDSKGKKHKDSDSPRYKALGNSIAVGYANNRSGFWCWLARRICAQYERQVTMASLFDGIGGFPLAFEAAGAKAVWASEIEEFPIAVTKLRFPEDQS